MKNKRNKKINEKLVERFITGKSYPIDMILRPMDNLLRNKPVSGILLFLAVVIALVWANSPWREAYHHLWETPFTIGFGEHNISKNLHHWINDGLMAVFFFVVVKVSKDNPLLMDQVFSRAQIVDDALFVNLIPQNLVHVKFIALVIAMLLLLGSVWGSLRLDCQCAISC